MHRIFYRLLKYTPKNVKYIDRKERQNVFKRQSLLKRAEVVTIHQNIKGK